MITFIRPIANQQSALAFILAGLLSLSFLSCVPALAQEVGSDSSEAKGVQETKFISNARELKW